MKEKPIVSIIMPTLNSDRTIEQVFKSILSQTYPQNKIQILVIDGGSSDETIALAKRYGCKILKNKRVQQEYAKHIGIVNAAGEYAMFLDSDEVLDNIRDMELKVDILKKYPEVMIILTSGYIRPEGYCAINDYINTFGDPFAAFMYGVSCDIDHYVSDLSRKYEVVLDSEDYAILRFHPTDILPLVDIAAGNMINLFQFKQIFAADMDDCRIIPQMFYMMAQKTSMVALVKNSGIIHYSADTLKKYVNKLRWRVIANIHYKNIPGTGFSSRQRFHSVLFRMKKYFFIPYSLSFILPLMISLRFLIPRKKPVLLVHAPLTFFTGFYILYQFVRKTLNKRPVLLSYGSGEKEIVTEE